MSPLALCQLALSTLIAAPAPADPPRLERPLAYLGYGPERGVVVLDAHRETVDVWGDEQEAACRALGERWVGPDATLASVETRPAEAFVLHRAPMPAADQKRWAGMLGRRYELIGPDGATCQVEAVALVRTVMWFNHQVSAAWEDPQTAVYAGPNERSAPPPRRAPEPGAPGPEVITADKLELAVVAEPPMWSGVEVRAIDGTCPLEGIAGAPGQLVPVARGAADPADREAVRRAFRGRASVKALERDFHKAVAEHGAEAVQCPAGRGRTPKHLDELTAGLELVTIDPEGPKPLLIAITGDSASACDPSRAAVIFKRSGKRWAPLRDFWGQQTASIHLRVLARDTRTGDLWVAGRPEHGVAGGWVWTVTALSRAGLGRTIGAVPDFGGHRCNYDVTEWEFAHPCQRAAVEDPEPD